MSINNKTSDLRLGTRGSQLALWQAGWTKNARLETIWSGTEVQIVALKTTGDRIQDVPLSEVGGKGLFTKELDEALLDGRIDIAVHSLKDLPFDLPAGLLLAAIGSREDPRDAFVSVGRGLQELSAGGRIGTSSLRRQAQLRHHFPGVDVVNLRGNVDTRLRKLDSGEYDGIILAAAGLKRLGHARRIVKCLDPSTMLPAIGQGALAFVCRESDQSAAAALRGLDHAETRAAVTAERAFMAAMEGNCRVPIAGYATVDGPTLLLEGLVGAVDGSVEFRERLDGPLDRPEELGRNLGQRLRSAGADRILDEIRRNGP